MKRQPQLAPYQQSAQMTSAFYGYNHNRIISDGEMYDMQNMSGDGYPLLTLRKKRGISSYDVSGQPAVPLTGIHGRDSLVYVRGTKVFYNFYEVEGLTVSDDTSMVPKQIVSFGAYVCIWPDCKYFNTANLNDYGEMGRTFTTDGTNITLTMCRGDGTNYDMNEIATGSTPPDEPENGDMWIDQSGDVDVLRQYVSYTDEWQEVATTYVKIGATGIGSGLKEYDVVEISGMEAASGATVRIQKQVEALNGSMIVYFCGEDYIVVAGLISQSVGALAAGDVGASIEIPDMDYICESNNRLWGCKYGLVGENTVNEIYASKLGDFRNWRCYMGLSTDSYTASVGTDGPFTGAVTQRGYPVFFKENCIHRVSGNTPATFTIQTTMCRGVQRGSSRSLAVVNENIYYKARGGVMVYDGNMPQSVGDQLGEKLYSDARAGVLGAKYYISMKDADNHFHLFNYDTEHGTWWKEDGTKALGFGTVGDELFYIDEEHNTLVSVTGSVGTEEADFDWAAEFDLYGVNYVRSSSYDSPERVRNSKYLSMFKVRAQLDGGAYMRLWIKYDDRLYEYIGEKRGVNLRSFVLPVVPKRCDHIRFKLTGHGGAAVYSISRIMEVGGDGI